MRKFLAIAAITFCVAMAIVIGARISTDAMAVILGIVCGVLASVPTTLVLLWVLRQRDRQLDAQGGQAHFGHYPPVVVVNGQGTNGHGSYLGPPMLTGTTSAPGSRDYKVVGQENTESNSDILPAFWE